MKVGDLVTHQMEGRYDEIGIVTNLVRATGVPGGMAKVLWNIEQSHRNDRLYRARHLEVVSESR